MKLYMFSTGVTRTRVGLLKLGGGDEDWVVPIPWYLIKHPQGVVVIDGGVGAEAVEDKHGYWGENVQYFDPILTFDQTCVEQAKSVGVRPEEVRYVVQSHLHLDHTGAVGRFPNAEHVVQKTEYEYAHNPDWFMKTAYLRKDFVKPGLKWKLLEDSEADGYDLFGDGTIRLISTPGHTPGHQSVIVSLPESGTILLTCDAAYTQDHWEEKCLPSLCTCNRHSVQSVRKLRQIADMTNALVVPGHDPDVWDTLRTGDVGYYG